MKWWWDAPLDRGPYLDADGDDLEMVVAPLLSSSGRFSDRPVGIQDTEAGSLVGFHFYDGDDDGVSKFALHTLDWHDGWPVVGALVATHGD